MSTADDLLFFCWTCFGSQHSLTRIMLKAKEIIIFVMPIFVAKELIINEGKRCYDCQGRNCCT